MSRRLKFQPRDLTGDEVSSQSLSDGPGDGSSESSSQLELLVDRDPNPAASKAHTAALQKAMEKSARLSEFIHYDSSLKRETPVDASMYSTLGDTDHLKVQQGVKFTQFMPLKKGQAQLFQSVQSADLSNLETLTFEEKMAKKQQEDSREGRGVMCVKEGKKLALKNRMSHQEYIHQHRAFVTLGHV